MGVRHLSVIVAGLLLTSTGCQTLTPQSPLRQTLEMFRPDSQDYEDGTDEDGSEWNFVGDEGRAGQHRERDPDPWFKENLMSPKARSIEHNLGID